MTTERSAWITGEGNQAASDALWLKRARQQKRRLACRQILAGALVCLVGIAVTVLSYAAASGGGTYVVAWGAIVFGGIQFIKGLGQLLG